MSYESISRSSGMSIDEKCTTLENMILSSPPGEVKEVYNDLKVLVKNEKNMSKHMSDAFMKYNFTNFVVGSIPSIETPVSIFLTLLLFLLCFIHKKSIFFKVHYI